MDPRYKNRSNRHADRSRSRTRGLGCRILGGPQKALLYKDLTLPSMSTTKRRTLYFLLGGLLLSIGTPAYLGLARPGMAGYLLNPIVFAAQSLPYFLAAGLWLPWRSARASTIGQVLAGPALAGCLSPVHPYDHRFMGYRWGHGRPWVLPDSNRHHSVPTSCLASRLWHPVAAPARTLG